MPLFHVHGLVASTLASFASGGCVLVPRRFTPRMFWRDAATYRFTWFSAAPTLHQMILEKREGSSPPDALRFVRSCSSALAPDVMELAEEGFGVPVLEAYGMTEASHQMASNPLPPAARVPGSVGTPAGAEIRIVDSSGGDVVAGKAGEVVIRGPGVMPGYVNNPDANRDGFFGEWFRTGDRAHFDDGYLRLEGRLKEMIIRGGENISPYEIEEALLSHPAVKDAACFGLPDHTYGEHVAAAVSLRGTVTERQLIAYCRERVAAFKVPKSVHVMSEVPRTPTGKLQRRRIAALFTERSS